jgi:hypothetical protein
VGDLTPDQRAAKAEYLRRWRAANREKIQETDRKYRENNRERLAEKSRQYRIDNPEPPDAPVREKRRRWRQENPDLVKQYDRRYREANRQTTQAKDRRRYWRDPDHRRAAGEAYRHGPGIAEWVARAWVDQSGCCYLCEQPLDRQLAHIDHDHRCCPTDSSCSLCRRGLACSRCNTVIGRVKDDPDLLVVIARNLGAVLPVIAARIDAKPSQMELDL